MAITIQYGLPPFVLGGAAYSAGYGQQAQMAAQHQQQTNLAAMGGAAGGFGAYPMGF